jgi:hypothetical protein
MKSHTNTSKLMIIMVTTSMLTMVTMTTMANTTIVSMKILAEAGSERSAGFDG